MPNMDGLWTWSKWDLNTLGLKSAKVGSSDKERSKVYVSYEHDKGILQLEWETDRTTHMKWDITGCVN